MRDIPIVMSAPMVRACIREVENPGSGKTETRRLLYSLRKGNGLKAFALIGHPPPRQSFTDPMDEYWTLSGWDKVQSGDRLWVRENWRADDFAKDDPARTIYQADAPADVLAETKGVIKWRPSIHLPRQRSRLTLVVRAVKIERLQAIREAGCIAEGAEIIQLSGNPVDDGPMVRLGPAHVYGTPRTWYRELWDTLHGSGAWDRNPEVVAISFRPYLVNIDKMPAQAA